MSTLVIAEAASTGSAEGDAKLMALLDSPSVLWVEASKDLMREARRLVPQYRHLSGADAVHLQSAIRAGASAIYTIDRKGWPVGETVSNVQVLLPSQSPGQQVLDFSEGAHETTKGP